MTTRAVDPREYKKGEKNNPEGLGIMGGKYKDQMNSMFDTREKQTENFKANLM